MNLGQTIAATKAKWDRKDSDYYPTPTETTQALVDYLKPYGKLRIREPCCGEGHISEVLKAAGHEVTSSDIRHTGYGDGGIDYIHTREIDPSRYDFQAVVTNPPFVAAESIIRRALRDAPVVAMLLSNNYWHASSRRRLFLSRKPKAVLALTWRPAFLEAERGSSPLANMVWTVWNDRHAGETQYLPVERPETPDVTVEVTSLIRLGRTGLLGEVEEAFERRLGDV